MGTTPELTVERLARCSLVAYSRYVDPTWVAHPHACLIAEALEDVERGRTLNLLITVPPQHGKTTLASRRFVAWYLGRHPDDRVILLTYGAQFSASHGRVARDLMRAFGPRLFGKTVRQDVSGADHWEVEGHRGGLHTAGIDGGISGNPAEGVIMDDPIKNHEEAHSPPIREKTIETYQSSVVTRRPRWKILIQTRWQENDLAGFLLEKEPGRWRHLNLPALAEEGDPLGRQVGEALCPAFQDRKALLEIKNSPSMTNYTWASLYQQRPIPLGGGLFKRQHSRRYELLEDELYVFDGNRCVTLDQMTRYVTCDTATSTKTSADYTAICAWGIAAQTGKLLLLDCVLERLEGPSIMEALARMCAKWRTIAYVEENATSKHLLSFMEAEHVPFRVVKPGSQNKLTRALPASGMWERGYVLLPERAEWLDHFERQLYRFTGADGGEDDAVDAFAYAVRVYMDELAPPFEAAPTTRHKNRLPEGVAPLKKWPGQG
jgi:predicted phage terminase large subunit-like protein